MCLATSSNLLLVLWDAPKHIFSTNSRSSCQPKNDAKTFFPTFHPLSQVIFATATVVAFVLLRNSRFSFHCYTQREATPTRKSARKWRCDLSRLLARNITKGIHSCKPPSLNRPVALGSYQTGAKRQRTALSQDQDRTQHLSITKCQGDGSIQARLRLTPWAFRLLCSLAGLCRQL